MAEVRITREVSGVPGTILLEAVQEDGHPIPGAKATVIGLIHGNEIVGGEVLSRLEQEAVRHLRAGSLLLVRANVEAAALGKRHTVEGTDLNRQWDTEHLRANREKPADQLNYEQRRALELAPLLESRDATLDLHSTSRPAPAFLVFRDDAAHAEMAAKLGIPYLVTGLHEGAVLDGGTCPDVGLLPGERTHRLGFTFESGQHHDPTNIQRAWEVSLRFLTYLGVWDEAPPPPEGFQPRMFEVIERFQQAPAGAEPWRFVGFVGGEPGGGRHSAPRPLASFDSIDADEIILRRGRERVVRAHIPFTMLLPTPNADPGTDLYYVAQERPIPKVSRRTHLEAHREALGIEQMLHLLDEDEYDRGNTKATFDSRQALDLCAEAIARTIELPVHHPHRRITIIGRGDWGGDEAERRAGQRYRAAMRRALTTGVPFERVQLLRGAAFGWFATLTTTAVMRMLEKRRMQHADEGVRLFLSARQPNTVAVLVLGDLERALAESDYRHVRVALMIEATSVEPDIGWVHVRVARSGLMSARPEILFATLRLLSALREEHVARMSAAATRYPGLLPLIDSNGALRLRGDSEALARLRDGLFMIQREEWRETLSDLQPTHLNGPEALGMWMAKTMVSTGILDPVGLFGLLVTPNGHQYDIDPSRLETAQLSDLERVVIPAEFTGRKLPPQPILASDVDADTIDRWIGWKRQLRGVQVIQNTRGKDIDLLFEETEITARVGSWMSRAQQLATERPGEVLVMIAGDGLSPTRGTESKEIARGKAVAELVGGHRDVLMDGNLRYLRIQHAQGTHLGWLKGMRDALAHRTSGQPVALQWEAAHGGSVNVILVCVRDPAVPEKPWSLEGWTVVCCSVLLAELRGQSRRDHRVGMFTDAESGHGNPDLLHFGRAHCEGLLSQVGPRIEGVVDESWLSQLDVMVIEQIGRWIERSRRSWKEANLSADVDRAAWIARVLALNDQSLAIEIEKALDSLEQAPAAAKRIWSSVQPWVAQG